jgi:hypothetical protein
MRALHYFVLAGMVLLSAGIIVIGRIIPPTAVLTLVGSGLIGVGVGSSVTPALYLVGFSVRSSGLQRVFAIVELLRAVAVFLIAPVLLHVAVTVGSSLSTGTTIALWIAFGLSVGGALTGVGLYALGRVRAHTRLRAVAGRRGAGLGLAAAAGCGPSATAQDGAARVRSRCGRSGSSAPPISPGHVRVGTGVAVAHTRRCRCRRDGAPALMRRARGQA